MSDRSVDPRTLAGDPIAYAAEMRRVRQSRRSYLEEIEAIHEEEARLGRPMSQREREAFVRGFHSQEYVNDVELALWMNILAREADEDGQE